jgi:hypothetical protein
MPYPTSSIVRTAPCWTERTAENRIVLRDARVMIERVRTRTSLPYADDMWSPDSDVTLELIAARLGAELLEDELAPATQELGVPGYFGVPVIIINRNIAPGLKRLALRHGLGHLVAGELDPEPDGGVRLMSSIYDWMTVEERRADLFAIADLVPGRMLRELALRGLTLDERMHWLWCELKRYAPMWPTARIADRVGLRLALYQEGRCTPSALPILGSRGGFP